MYHIDIIISSYIPSFYFTIYLILTYSDIHLIYDCPYALILANGSLNCQEFIFVKIVKDFQAYISH